MISEGVRVGSPARITCNCIELLYRITCNFIELLYRITCNCIELLYRITCSCIELLYRITCNCIELFYRITCNCIELFYQPTLMHSFLYSLTICLLHYYPQHVSSINMPIFRRKNCIHTASSIFTLCKRLHGTLCTVFSVLCRRLQRSTIPDAV